MIRETQEERFEQRKRCPYCDKIIEVHYVAREHLYSFEKTRNILLLRLTSQLGDTP